MRPDIACSALSAHRGGATTSSFDKLGMRPNETFAAQRRSRLIVPYGWVCSTESLLERTLRFIWSRMAPTRWAPLSPEQGFTASQ